MSSLEQTTIVVGGGVMGVCTAWSLIKNEIGPVTLIDSFELPRSQGGASVDGGRAIRYSYGKEIGYMIMVQDAYQSWYDLFEDIGETLYTQTGSVLLQLNNNSENNNKLNKFPVNNFSVMDDYNSFKQYQEQLGIDFQLLSNSELKTKFPYLMCDGIDYGMYTSSGGVLHAHDIIAKTVEWLKRQPNVNVLEGSEFEVTKIITKDQDFLEEDKPENFTSKNICLLKSGQILKCDNLVIAVNNYTNDLIPEIKYQGNLVPTRQEVTYFKVEEDEVEDWKSRPFFLEHINDEFVYLLPYVGGTGTYGFKASDHTFSSYSDIHTEDYKPLEGFNKKALNWVNTRFLSKSGKPYKPNYIKVCYYDVYPEERFQMHPLDTTGSAIALYGFSGHGFKFGSLVGKATASVISGTKTLRGVKEWLAGKTTLRFSDVK